MFTVDDIALTLQPRVGPKTAAHLIKVFGSAQNVFSASVEELVIKAELKPEFAKNIVLKQYHSQAEREIKSCLKNEIQIISSTSDFYPELLKEIDDYPHVIFYKGDPQLLQTPMVSIVGTRKATDYGKKMCRVFIEGFKNLMPSITIVSGLAYGIDIEAHKACLNNGIKTIAVLPCPLNRIYPTQHSKIAYEILRQGGGLISEYHTSTKEKGVNFIGRNRIIAGLGTGTIVVESAKKGGSLITASLADGYNRVLMAVPGRADSPASEGTNKLIATQKAVMVCNAEETLKEMMFPIVPHLKYEIPVEEEFDTVGSIIVDILKERQRLHIDEITNIMGITVSEASTALFELEMDGRVMAFPGKFYEVK